jgi:hypothetical protein
MAKNSDGLRQAVLEAAHLQAEHRSPRKEAALLKLLTKGTSKGRQGGSTSAAPAGGPSRKMSDEELIAAVMAQHPGLTEEEARADLEAAGM